MSAEVPEHFFRAISRKGEDIRALRSKQPYLYPGEVTILNLSELEKRMRDVHGAPSVTVGLSGDEVTKLKRKVAEAKLKRELYESEAEMAEARRRREQALNPGSADQKPGKIVLVNPDSSEPEKTVEVKSGETIPIIKTGEGRLGISIQDIVTLVDSRLDAKVSDIKSDMAEIKSMLRERKTGGTADMEAYVDRKFKEHESSEKLDKVMDLVRDVSRRLERVERGEVGGGVRRETDLLDKLNTFGLLKKGESLTGTLEELRKLGVIRYASDVEKRISAGTRTDQALSLAMFKHLWKMWSEEEDRKLRREKLGLLRDFAKHVGGAFADALEEVEKEEEGLEEKKERKAPEKTEAGIEKVLCDACKGEIAIPPEAQVKGKQIKCPKCGSIYEYEPEEKAETEKEKEAPRKQEEVPKVRMV